MDTITVLGTKIDNSHILSGNCLLDIVNDTFYPLNKEMYFCLSRCDGMYRIEQCIYLSSAQRR
jgi:hypothetical protein